MRSEDDDDDDIMTINKKNSGLFLVNFSTEPVGLSPPNFTEPDGKTASPRKTTILVNFLIM